VASINGANERFKPIKATASLYICITAPKILLGIPPCGSSGGFIEKMSISAMGAKTRSKSVLRRGKHYRLIVSGLYQYDQGEIGTLADAEYEENDNRRFVRSRSLAINGSLAKPVKSNLASHSYEYSIIGSGAPIYLHIDDSNYRDNAGSLTAKLYGPK